MLQEDKVVEGEIEISECGFNINSFVTRRDRGRSDER